MSRSNDRGAQRPYRMLATGTHDGVLVKAGASVMLYDDEVGPQHGLIYDGALPAARPRQSASALPPGLSGDNGAAREKRASDAARVRAEAEVRKTREEAGKQRP